MERPRLSPLALRTNHIPTGGIDVTGAAGTVHRCEPVFEMRHVCDWEKLRGYDLFAVRIDKSELAILYDGVPVVRSLGRRINRDRSNKKPEQAECVDEAWYAFQRWRLIHVGILMGIAPDYWTPRRNLLFKAFIITRAALSKSLPPAWRRRKGHALNRESDLVFWLRPIVSHSESGSGIAIASALSVGVGLRGTEISESGSPWGGHLSGRLTGLCRTASCGLRKIGPCSGHSYVRTSL